jgi:hypothetical protein
MRRNRTFIVLLVIVTVLAMATAALAAQPPGKGKPDKPPAAYFDVTIGLLDNEPGLASICPLAEPLRASESGGHAGSVLHADGEPGTSPADLYYRGPGFEDDGCHTGIADGSPTSGAQFFRVYRTKAGELNHIDWFFDVDVTPTTKKGERTGRYQVNHKYWLKSIGDLSWSNEGKVTGAFELWEYTLENDPRWKLLTPTDPPTTLTFTMHIESAS